MDSIQNKSNFSIHCFPLKSELQDAHRILSSYLSNLILMDLLVVIINYCQDTINIDHFLSKKYGWSKYDLTWQRTKKHIDNKDCRILANALQGCKIIFMLESNSEKPWGCGITLDEHYSCWSITGIKKNQQAEQLGVMNDDRLIAIDGEDIKESNCDDMKNMLKERNSCKITILRMGAVQKLSLIDANIGDEGASAIGNALKTNRSLKTMSLGTNKISDNGVICIAEALKINCYLQKLYLYSNMIGSVGADAIANALKVNVSLNELSLKWNNIGDTGVTSLGNALHVNKTLKTLWIQDNKITDLGATVLGQSLKINSTLETLNVAYNIIADEGAAAIGRGLTENSSLTYLDLFDNDIGDAGARIIVEGIKSNTSFNKLALNKNKISINVTNELNGILGNMRGMSFAWSHIKDQKLYEHVGNVYPSNT